MVVQMTEELPASFKIQRFVTISYPFFWDMTRQHWGMVPNVLKQRCGGIFKG
jgi:hypothetical protein